MVNRCEWVGDDPLMREYHDIEWGTPQHEDQILYEFILLEGMQAGLSWSTVLKKRESFRKAFDNFDYKIISKYDEKKVEKLLLNQDIIRNRLKINSATINAKLFITIQTEFGSFNNYIWKFVDNMPIDNKIKSMSEIPTHTELSDLISKDMKKRGFKFVGTTIMYAFMQSIGMVNDHVNYCFRYEEIKKSES